MTEDEARTKWCPFASSRAVEYVNSDGDRLSSRIEKAGKISVTCIASACMAWRWTVTPGQARDEHDGAIADGFCGLAGAPR